MLPALLGARTQLVIFNALQMGRGESPPYFYAGTETARDIVEKYVKEPEGSFLLHPLEEHMLPPSKWSAKKIG